MPIMLPRRKRLATGPGCFYLCVASFSSFSLNFPTVGLRTQLSTSLPLARLPFVSLRWLGCTVESTRGSTMTFWRGFLSSTCAYLPRLHITQLDKKPRLQLLTLQSESLSLHSWALCSVILTWFFAIHVYGRNV